jgi:hypothetical protein
MALSIPVRPLGLHSLRGHRHARPTERQSINNTREEENSMTTAELTNEYATESDVRNEVTEAATTERYLVESYGITDKDTQRTVTVTLAGDSDERPLLHKSLALAFAQHGYTLDSIKVTAKAIKDTAQIRLPLG